jgi:hypothetical protein
MTILQIMLILLFSLVDLRARGRSKFRLACALENAHPVPGQRPAAPSNPIVAHGRNCSGM